MIQIDGELRPTVDDILNHEWLKDDLKFNIVPEHLEYCLKNSEKFNVNYY